MYFPRRNGHHGLALATLAEPQAQQPGNMPPQPGAPVSQYTAAPPAAPLSQYVAAAQAQPQPLQPQQLQPQQPVAQQPQAPAAAPQAGVIQPEPAQFVAVPTQPQVATSQEIRQHCPNASADFILEMVERQATLPQAQATFIHRLQQTQQPAAPQTAQTVAHPSHFAAPSAAVPTNPAPLPAAQPQPQPVQAYQQPAQVAPAQVAPAQAWNPNQVGNAPVQVEPTQTMPAMNYPGGAKAYFEQLVKSEKHMLMTAGYDALDAHLQAMEKVDKENPGLREQAYQLGPIEAGNQPQVR